MIQSKKYNVMSFVLLIMRIIPLQSLYNILHTILSSLLPAAKTLAIANFIDSAGSIFEGEKEFSSWKHQFPLLSDRYGGIMLPAA